MKAVRFYVGVALMCAMLFIFPPVAKGQYFTKEVQNHYDKFSVIHEVGIGEWLVSDFNTGNKKSVFSLITETGAVTNQLELYYILESDSTIVRDFKIYRDTVFFFVEVERLQPSWEAMGIEWKYWGDYVTMKPLESLTYKAPVKIICE